MRPTHLTLTDFRSFATLDFDFESLSLAAVVGENGAGKSTMLTAVLVALYGTAVRRSLGDYIRRDASAFEIVLDFQANGHVYRVVREVGKQHKVSLTVDGKPVADDKVKETDAAIVDAIGYDYDGFTLANWLGQGALGRFASLDPAKRKEWLASVLPMKVWPLLESEAKRRAAALKDERLTAQAVVDTLDIDDTTTAREEIPRLEAELVTLEERGAKAAERLDATKEQASKASIAGAKVHEAGTVLDSAMRALADKEAEADRVTSKMATLKTRCSTEPRALPDTTALNARRDMLLEEKRKIIALREAARMREVEVTRLSVLLEQADAKAEVLKRRLHDFESAPTDEQVCDRCGQHVADKARAQMLEQYSTEAEAAHTRHQEAFDNHMSLLTTHEAELDAIPDVPDAEIAAVERELSEAEGIRQENEAHGRAKAELAGMSDALTIAQSAISDAKAAVDAARDTQAKAQQDLDAFGSVMMLDQAVRDATSTVDACRSEYARIRDELSGLKAQVERADRDADRIKAAKERLDTVAREESDLALLVKAYGKSGIQARLIESAVAAIEDEANAYLEHFTAGLRVEMSTQRDNKTEGVRETLDILVDDGTGGIAIDLASGGENTRVNFALAVGLSRFMAREHGPIDSFVVDEPDALDSAGMADFVECLHVLAETTPLVMAVSHIESITDSLPQRVSVSKGVNGSRVEVVS